MCNKYVVQKKKFPGKEAWAGAWLNREATSSFSSRDQVAIRQAGLETWCASGLPLPWAPRTLGNGAQVRGAAILHKAVTSY